MWTRPRRLPPEGNPHSWPGPSYGLAPSPESSVSTGENVPAGKGARSTADRAQGTNDEHTLPPRSGQPGVGAIRAETAGVRKPALWSPALGSRARFPSNAEENGLAWGAMMAARRTRRRHTVPQMCMGVGQSTRVRAEQTGWGSGEGSNPAG